VLSPGFRRAGKAGSTLLLVGAAEHPCVLDGHRFPPEAVERIPVSGEGVVDLGWLEGRLARAPGPVLVSIQAANNETGVIQPVPEAARLVGRAGGLLHVDAVQAAGRIDLGSLDADALTLSAHKIGGPQGVGAIVMGSESLEFADRLLRGGGQERGHRAGTENVAGIVGFGVAAEIAARELATEPARLAGLRDAFEAGLREAVPGAVVFGAGAARLPNTSAFAIPGVRAETALIRLDLAGIAVSSGAACSSGKVRRSHVLAAMGVDPRLAEGAVRASFGWGSTSADVARLLGACETLGASLYKRKADAA
jgi:cysteine desulfurase